MATCAGGILYGGEGACAQGSDTTALLEPVVVIKGVLSDGEPYPFGKDVRLPRGWRNLEVRYEVEGGTDETNYHYRFWMERLEDEWAEAGERTVAYYRHLPAGDYLFHAAAIAPDGVQAREAVLPIHIEPYFYERTWFWALLGLLLVGGVLGAYRWQAGRIVRQAKRLERLVDERSKALQAEKERAEEALATVEEQALQLLRVDHMKSRLFANLSHEFRTPLTLILDPLDRVQRGEFDTLDEETRRAFDVARQNARRLLRLINQLLELAKLEAGSIALQAREADLVPFLRQATNLFTSEATYHGVQLSFEPAAPHLPVYFDREKLEKVVFNLLANALKATPAGGKVLVMARTVHGEQAGVPGYAEISVRDTGVGIPAEALPHVFDRFYQVEGGERRGGTGIGLSLAKEMVELHRGRIGVESLPGFGSTFTVRLPLGREHLADHEVVAGRPEEEPFSSWEVQPEAAAGGAPSAAAEPARPEGVTKEEAGARPLVLVVEDNPEIRALVVKHLRAHYRVAEASDGAVGLRLAREQKPDLIVSDVLMSGMDGLELCRRIKEDERLADTPVILLTALASDESRLEGLATRADDYLTKPFSDEELVTRAANLIRTRAAMRERFSHEVVLQPFGVPVQSADAAFMERVFAAIEVRLDDSALTIGDLAAEVGLSVAQLKRRIRAIMDRAPVELIRDYRLERAAELLRRRVGGVSEVAYSVGFQSPAYFAKCFRERFGVTPSAYARSEGDGEAEAAD